MYSLRPYQQNAVNAGMDYFKSHTQKNPVLMVEPTGCGKSLILSNLAKELNEPVMIFQPTREILEQNYHKLMDYNVQGVTIYSASMKKKEIGNITLATIGSVYTKPEYFKQFRYFLMDECHAMNAKGGIYKGFYDTIGGKWIGLTATPYRQNHDGFGGTMMKFLTRTNPRVFSRVAHYTQTKELSNLGFMSKNEYFQINGFSRSSIKLNSTGADYDDTSERHYYDNISFDQRLIGVVKRLLAAGKTRILVFTKFVHEAESLAKALGEDAAMVHGGMGSKERTDIISRFRKGLIKVVCNAQVLLFGFDYPELQVVVLARPTRSLTLYYQMIGRVVRPHPSKETSWIIDLCGNYQYFGKIEDMELVEENPNIWSVQSKGRKLTNVYLDKIMND